MNRKHKYIYVIYNLKTKEYICSYNYKDLLRYRNRGSYMLGERWTTPLKAKCI